MRQEKNGVSGGAGMYGSGGQGSKVMLLWDSNNYAAGQVVHRRIT